MSTYVIGDVHGRFELLKQLERDVPWDLEKDKIVFLGDLIDRGDGIREVVDEVIRLQSNNPNVIVLRGNHEQMLLDCIDFGDLSWLIPENGGQETIEQYGCPLHTLTDIDDIKIPAHHVRFFRGLPLYHEDDMAIYVHAGLEDGLHPSETDEDTLLWSRDFSFYMHYFGKLCFFGHTPTKYLPREGRTVDFDIFMASNSVGVDTGSEPDQPLSCLRVDDFTLYQAFAEDGTIIRDHRGLLDAYHERFEPASAQTGGA